MELIRLNEAEICSIYHGELVFDFPADEVKPLSRILKMLHDGIYFGYGLYENGVLNGYAFFVRSNREPAALLDYFAVTRGRRGGGIGSRFLALLFDELRELDSFILESEAIDTAKNEEETRTRTRRIAFYLRNGLWQTGIRSVVFGVTYEILIRSTSQSSEAELRQALGNIYHQMFAPDYSDRAVIL